MTVARKHIIAAIEAAGNNKRGKLLRYPKYTIRALPYKGDWWPGHFGWVISVVPGKTR